MMSKKRCFFKNQELFCEKIDGVGVILFDEESKVTHLLNQSAMLIWELIDGKTDVYEIYTLYSKLINFAEISQSEVENDFYQTISLLEEKDIIRG